MSSRLSYPGFSIVFIQTFNIHHSKEFILPEEAVKQMDTPFTEHNQDKTLYTEKADALGTPIAWVERDIENQIFSLPANSPFEKPQTSRKRFFGKQPRIVPMKGNVRRFSLRGFDFSMPIVPQKDEEIPPVTLSGHCNVEMNLFFGQTASITYRFLFDGISCAATAPVITDHLIIFLSNWLNAEYWSQDEEDEGKTTIEYQTHLSVSSLWLAPDGEPLKEPESFRIQETGRSFDVIALRYKNFIYKKCTQFKADVSRAQQRKYLKRWYAYPFNLDRDSRYAMVDIWENLQHINEDGSDLFQNDKKKKGYLTEAQIINHIREEHKNELIGLLSLYPEEWPFRDPEAYDEVCGGNIAIDTDDLVLAGSSLCVVIGTYGRRGQGEQGVNWKKHLEERAHYHVSWPEYLLILQMILAKKHVIGLATDTVVESSVDAGKKISEERLIKKNADMSMRLSRMVTQLDIVKYAKYPSHKVMYDRTSSRLGLEEDYERLNTVMENVDSSLHNMTDYKAMHNDFILNIILAILSVASTFELFFQESELPFLSHYNIPNEGLAAALVAGVVCATIMALLYVVVHFTRSIISRIRSMTNA